VAAHCELVVGDLAGVIAVLHQKRRPISWKPPGEAG